MSIHISREEFLERLQAVKPGVANREIQQQSSCFVFVAGDVITFNDEVSCRYSSGLPEKVTGAVKAAPLISILSEMPDEQVDIDFEETRVVVSARRKKARIPLEKEIMLGYTSVESPKKWKKLPDDFNDALMMVIPCAGKDQHKFYITCVHISPEFLEAQDNFQMIRWWTDTGIGETLIRAEGMKDMPALGMVEFSESDNWLHFRNPNKLVYSCRKMSCEYHDISSLYEVEGSKISFPKSLGSVVARAEIFSRENVDDNDVMLQLQSGYLRVVGDGTSGDYTEDIKVPSYKSKDRLTFLVKPSVITSLSEAHNQAVICENRIKVDGGKWKYVTCLGRVEENKTYSARNGSKA